MVTLKGKLVSFQHSINFTRVQDVSIMANKRGMMTALRIPADHGHK